MLELLLLLSDGRFHSGAALGVALGVSRASVWKQVRVLRARGVKIDALKGMGYRVPGGLDLLDSRAIQARMSEVAVSAIQQLEVFDLVDSTNSLAMEWARNSLSDGAGNYACLAEQQTSGRGRRGRIWVSPFGKNIYLSLSWRIKAGYTAIKGLSVAVGVAVCEALESLGCNGIWLKWPNDVYHGQSKLAGILIEAVGDVGGDCVVVIGLGVNVSMPDGAGCEIDRPWTDLATLGHKLSRNQLAARLLSSLVSALNRFEAEGLDSFTADWQRLDGLLGKYVVLTIGSENALGIASGIDSNGSLLLDTPAGTQSFFAGEVSVKEWR